MQTFELISTKTLAPRRLRWLRFCGFLSLLHVAVNRWMEGLPIRVLTFKK